MPTEIRSIVTKPKVLIVDDQRTNLMLMSHMLENQDVYILEAMSGRVAIELMSKYTFAVVLMDVSMPEMDGFETAEIIRGNKEISNTPIVFVTALDPDPENISRGYEVGAVDFLFRPLNPEIINSKVKVFVELYKQKKELEESNESLAHFSRMICHDARDPMRHIVCFADLLRQSFGDELSDDASAIVDQLSKSAYRAKVFYEDLQMFINATNEYEIKFEVLDLNKLISDVLEGLSESIKESGAVIRVEELGTINTGATAFGLIIQNLISNSIKYVEEGMAPEINISGEYIDYSPDERCYRITVEDNGIGIDEKYQKQIFEPFKRLHGGGSNYSGSGLGLSTCKKLADYINASISLESEEGSGARFSITVPS